LTSWWVIGVLVVLLAIEMTVDKIPAADTVNDIVNTAIRPMAGAVLFAANSGVIGEMHPVVALIVGLIVAGGVHAVKATARPVVTATTAGTGNWAVSLVEDLVSLVTSILSILVPVLIVIIIVLMVGFIGWRISRRRPRAANG
jgi:hypothetical protein